MQGSISITAGFHLHEVYFKFLNSMNTYLCQFTLSCLCKLPTFQAHTIAKSNVDYHKSGNFRGGLIIVGSNTHEKFVHMWN